jgi:hypothetical protein
MKVALPPEEEMSKLVRIVACSAGIGAALFLIASAVDEIRKTPLEVLLGIPFSFVLMSFATVFVFIIAFAFALPVATAVHLLLRWRPLPRVALLPLFIIVGYLTSILAGGDLEVVAVPLGVLTSIAAWVLYCFGRWRLFERTMGATQP